MFLQNEYNVGPEDAKNYYNKAQVIVAGERYEGSFKTGKNKKSKPNCYVYVNLDATINTE